MKSHCDVGAHQPVQDHEYRVVYYLDSANTPRWLANYHSKLDTALDQLAARRANGDTTARLEQCAWLTVADPC